MRRHAKLIYFCERPKDGLLLKMFFFFLSTFWLQLLIQSLITPNHNSCISILQSIHYDSEIRFCVLHIHEAQMQKLLIVMILNLTCICLEGPRELYVVLINVAERCLLVYLWKCYRDAISEFLDMHQVICRTIRNQKWQTCNEIIMKCMS